VPAGEPGLRRVQPRTFLALETSCACWRWTSWAAGTANLFLRGIVPLLGFRTGIVTYDRGERFAGQSKYPLKKMLAFALEGITSFSVVPLRLITLTGFVMFASTLALSVWVLRVKFLGDQAVPGWASTVLPLYFVGGVQILCLGIVGEYLAKIYGEVKRRPRYVIERLAGPTGSSGGSTAFTSADETSGSSSSDSGLG
jgi:hypothetical protein